LNTKVDVAINYYGKSFQTIATIQSLLNYSHKSIDKIYLVVEKKQPFFSNLNFIKRIYPNLILYTPSTYEFMKSKVDYFIQNDRFKVRYQFPIENSDKKYIFLSHNDVLYTGDVVGEMLAIIEGNAGVGQIGQCWNCPASFAKKCNPDSYHLYRPSTKELIELINQFPSPRTNLNCIDYENTFPLPECRLNEWACLLDRELLIKESKPVGNGPLFGEYDKLDLGSKWFKYMNLLGYTFRNYNQKYIHGFWANDAGYPIQQSTFKYLISELKALFYLFEKNLIFKLIIGRI
jgi:hypothetical protein